MLSNKSSSKTNNKVYTDTTRGIETNNKEGYKITESTRKPGNCLKLQEVAVAQFSK